MSKLIVVIGLTGNQGSSVAGEYLKDPTWKVRGVTRDPSKPASQAFATKGVEVVAGDLDDPKSLKKAFQGANMIFANTAFPMMSVIAPSKSDIGKLKRGQSLKQRAYEAEVQQGRNIADAAASVANTLELFVWSTLSDARKWSKGKYTGVYHFCSKAAVVEYIHNSYPDLAEKTSLLQMGYFMDNWKFGKVGVPLIKSDGKWILRVPGTGNYPAPFVVPSEAGLFVKALEKLKPGRNLLAYGSLVTWEEYAAAWGKATGNSIKFERGTIEDHAKYLPGGWGEEIGEMLAYGQEYGYWGGKDKSVTMTKDLHFDIKATTLDEYMAKEDWSQILHSE